jgi:DNA-binding response OmpR family regulator
MRRILVVPELSGPDFLRRAMKLGATRCLRKPFRPTTLLRVIDECLSEAEPHRRYVATLNAVTNALCEPQRRMKSSDGSKDEALTGRTIRFQSKARSVVLGRAAQKDVA